MKKIINNKRGQTLKILIMAVVIGSFFLVGLFKVYTGLAVEYGVSVNDTFANESFNKIDEINVIAKEVGTSIDTSEATVTDSVVSFLTLPFKALKIMWKAFDISLSFVSQVKEFLFVDALVYTFVITVILISFVFAIITALLSK